MEESDLRAAIRILKDRKQVIHEKLSVHGDYYEEEHIRSLLVGTDTDFDELMTSAFGYAIAGMRGLADMLANESQDDVEGRHIAEDPIARVLAGMYVEGYLTGVITTDVRQKREAKEERGRGEEGTSSESSPLG